MPTEFIAGFLIGQGSTVLCVFLGGYLFSKQEKQEKNGANKDGEKNQK